MDITLKQTRNKTIKNYYFDALKNLKRNNPYVSTEDVINELLRMEAPCFYISFGSAQRIISRMKRGLPICINNPTKMNMYNEIYKRYIDLEANGYISLEQVLASKAPSFYIDQSTMRGIVYKILKTR